MYHTIYGVAIGNFDSKASDTSWLCFINLSLNRNKSTITLKLQHFFANKDHKKSTPTFYRIAAPFIDQAEIKQSIDGLIAQAETGTSFDWILNLSFVLTQVQALHSVT